MNNKPLDLFVKQFKDDKSMHARLHENIIVETIIHSTTSDGRFNHGQTRVKTPVAELYTAYARDNDGDNYTIVNLVMAANPDSSSYISEEHSKLFVNTDLITRKFKETCANIGEEVFIASITTYVYLNDKYDPMMTTPLLSHHISNEVPPAESYLSKLKELVRNMNTNLLGGFFGKPSTLMS
jgi:sulfur transfer complex TusBCD TusB component (DsrH family)